MLPTNLISALQNLTRASDNKPLVTATPDPTASKTPQLNVGQEVQGTIQSKLGEGLFKVQVASQSLQMRLPNVLQSGDVVKLQVISNSPRLTFSMIASQNPLSTPEQIGSTARMLSNLADQPLERPAVQQLGRGSVWPSADKAPDTKQLAGDLRTTLSNSGLFYESHQAQWVRGERSTAQLLVEPQNVLTGRTPPQTGEGKAAPSAPAATAAQQAVLAKAGAEQQGTQAAQATGKETEPVMLKADTPPPALHRPAQDSGQNIARELMPLVQQQLHALETHQLTWIGQVWPEQEMRWTVQGDAEHRRSREEGRQWSTDMELSLPRLGGVQARFVLGREGLQLTLRPTTDETANLFQQALPNLRDALSAANIPLVQAKVERT